MKLIVLSQDLIGLINNFEKREKKRNNNMHHFFLSHYKWFRCGFSFHVIDFYSFCILAPATFASNATAAVLNATAQHSNHLKWFMTEKLRLFVCFICISYEIARIGCRFCVLLFTRRMRKYKLCATHTHLCIEFECINLGWVKKHQMIEPMFFAM